MGEARAGQGYEKMKKYQHEKAVDKCECEVLKYKNGVEYPTKQF